MEIQKSLNQYVHWKQYFEFFFLKKKRRSNYPTTTTEFCIRRIITETEREKLTMRQR